MFEIYRRWLDAESEYFDVDSSCLKMVHDIYDKVASEGKQDAYHTLKSIGDVLRNMGAEYERNCIISSAKPGNMKLDCKQYSLINHAVATELGVDVEFMLIPDHILLRVYEPDGKNYPWEPLDNSATTDQTLIYNNYIHPKPMKNKIYLSDLDDSGMDSLMYATRAVALYVSNKDIDALDDIETSLEYDPNNINALFNRASIRAKMISLEWSLEDLDKVIDIDPRYIQAFNLRAEIKKELGDYEGMRDDYQKSMDIIDEFYKNNIIEAIVLDGM